MKKIYLQPAMTVVELKLKSNILIGSEITDIDTNLGTGDDIDFGGPGGDIPALTPEITEFMGEEF
jgi:hypothetical protein